MVYNMSEEKKYSSSHDRKMTAYPPPPIHEKAMAYIEKTGMTKSELITDALRNYAPLEIPQKKH